MEFARRQLEKTGWKDGRGLGKHETGVAQAVKATFKMDNCGIGYDKSKDFSNDWWTAAFNRSAKKLIVTTGESGALLHAASCTGSGSETAVEQSANLSGYEGFVKESGNSELCIRRTDMPKTQIISDDELFIACGGRTAHRAARHGLQLTGKLQRLAKQEQQVSSENENDKSVDCQHRKAKKRSQANRKPTQSQGEPGQDLCIAVDGDFTMDSPDCQIPKRKRKAKHRQ